MDENHLCRCLVTRTFLGMVWGWVVWGRGRWVVWSGCGFVGGRVSRSVVLGFVVVDRVCLTLILDISNEAIFVVSVVSYDLGAAIRELHSVFTLDSSVFILSLSLLEVVAIVVNTAIFVCEWLWWSLLLMIWGGMVWSVIWGWCRWVVGCWCRCIGSGVSGCPHGSRYHQRSNSSKDLHFLVV